MKNEKLNKEIIFLDKASIVLCFICILLFSTVVVRLWLGI